MVAPIDFHEGPDSILYGEVARAGTIAVCLTARRGPDGELRCSLAWTPPAGELRGGMVEVEAGLA